jgi:hypothetical protein
MKLALIRQTEYTQEQFLFQMNDLSQLLNLSPFFTGNQCNRMIEEEETKISFQNGEESVW